jgi:hypothetical protein
VLDLATVFGEYRGTLRGVDGTATPDGDDAVALGLLELRRGPLDRLGFRVRNDAVEDGVLELVGFEGRLDRIEHTDLDEVRVGDEEGALGAELPEDLVDPRRRFGAGGDRRRTGKLEVGCRDHGANST